MKKYDLGTIQSNIEQMLLRACEEHENAIIAYGEASDVYSDCFIAYRKKKSEVTKRLKKEGEKVTIIKDLANGETLELKGELLKAEGQMTKCKMIVNALENRINAVKFIGKRLDFAVQNPRG
jgi:hypothetical protein